MSFQPASPASVGAFLAVVVFVVGAFLAGAWRASKDLKHSPTRFFSLVCLGLLLWLGTLSLVVHRGLLIDAPPPRFMAFFAAVNLVSLAAALSPLGRRFAMTIPIVALVGFQSFRLPLELILHAWAKQGTIPFSMTWSGSNFDVVSGVVALVAAPFAGRHRAIAWFANLVGFALLLNVMRVAVFSSPLPFAWGVEPPLQLASYLPYALIAPVCVGGALFGHIVLTRALLGNGRA